MVPSQNPEFEVSSERASKTLSNGTKISSVAALVRKLEKKQVRVRDKKTTIPRYGSGAERTRR